MSKEIKTATYLFSDGSVRIHGPWPIERETEKCLFTKHKQRFSKSELGVPALKYAAHYPYVEVVMINAGDNELHNALSQWFIERATFIKEGVCE